MVKKIVKSWLVFKVPNIKFWGYPLYYPYQQYSVDNFWSILVLGARFVWASFQFFLVSPRSRRSFFYFLKKGRVTSRFSFLQSRYLLLRSPLSLLLYRESRYWLSMLLRVCMCEAPSRMMVVVVCYGVWRVDWSIFCAPLMQFVIGKCSIDKLVLVQWLESFATRDSWVFKSREFKFRFERNLGFGLSYIFHTEPTQKKIRW